MHLPRLTSTHLKTLAVVAMVVDHLAFFLPGTFPIWLRWIGRLAAPIFLWLVVQNTGRTRSKVRYFGRLISSSLIMLAGSLCVLLGGILIWGKYSKDILTINIFVTLALAVAFTCVVDLTISSKTSSQRLIWALAGLVILGVSHYAEGGLQFFILAAIYALSRGSTTKLVVGSVGYSVVLLFLGLLKHHSLATDFQWMCIAALPFLLLASTEKKRPSVFEQRFFYFFYPIHIWVLYLISLALS